MFRRDKARERRALIIIAAMCAAAYFAMGLLGPFMLAHPIFLVGPTCFFFMGWVGIRGVHGPEISVSIDRKKQTIRIEGSHYLSRDSWVGGVRELTIMRFDQIEAATQSNDSWKEWTELKTAVGTVRIASAVEPNKALRDALESIASDHASQ